MKNNGNAHTGAKIGAVLAHELPLVVFTTFSPAAVGVALVCAIYLLVAVAFGLDVLGFELVLSIVSLALVTVGMLASVLHLAKPLRAPFSIIHWKQSWLSREILAVSAFWAIDLAWFLSALFACTGVVDVFVPALFNCVALIAGCVLIGAIAMAYKTKGQPAWDGPETAFELAACALRGGVPAAVAVLALVSVFCGDAGLEGFWGLWSLWGVGAGCVLITTVAAHVLDSRAAVARCARLCASEPSTRVNECLRLRNVWNTDLRRLLLLALALGLLFAVCCVFAACLVFAAALSCAIACTVIAIAIMAVQMLLRVCFYGLFTTARTVPRFPGIS